jgi:hypothetical protein
MLDAGKVSIDTGCLMPDKSEPMPDAKTSSI